MFLLGGTFRGKKRLLVTNEDRGEVEEHLIPHGRHIIVHKDDLVYRGQPLTEGEADPHEILEILGASVLQEYLISEIQKVYQMQGVTINDKHIELIIACMLKKGRITEVGDSNYFWGEQVDLNDLKEANKKLEEAGGEVAKADPILMSITKSSIETTSFISAASFQDTTRVLAEAATLGKRDELKGFKENLIMGQLIPAGSGFPKYRNIRVTTLVDKINESEGKSSKEATARLEESSG